jgi:hypothetical protein
MSTVESFLAVVADGTPQTVKLPPKEKLPLGPVKAVYATGKHFIAYTDSQGQFWYVQNRKAGHNPGR